MIMFVFLSAVGVLVVNFPQKLAKAIRYKVRADRILDLALLI